MNIPVCDERRIWTLLSGSPSDKRNEEACHLGAEEQVHSGDQVPTSDAIKDSLYKMRYFIIKSLNHENIQLSIKKGLWATQIMNEPILEEAFRNSGKVILIFSVNTSGFFQGYAQMMSSIGGRREDIWGQESGKNRPWGRSFKVKWLCLHDLPFQKTLHLKNPWNYCRPVKISRDCQELPQDIGEALCELLDGRDDVEINLKRDEVRDDLSSQCLYKEQLHSFQNEVYNVPPLHMEPMLGPSLLYQHQAEVDRYHLAHMRKNGLSAERCPHAFTLTDDDILEMEVYNQLKQERKDMKLGSPSIGLLAAALNQLYKVRHMKSILKLIAEATDGYLTLLLEHLKACRNLHPVKNILMIRKSILFLS